jgi:hypothetical protein
VVERLDRPSKVRGSLLNDTVESNTVESVLK